VRLTGCAFLDIPIKHWPHFFYFYFSAVKFPGSAVPMQDSQVISAASASDFECPPALQEQPQAVIPQGKKQLFIFL
jgi:hypothetical protein